ncbi:hypothetical protein B0H17DRAFT_1139554 [Mycena rosella]|uniref:Uncharacterized protein n=1 Tax=Mycena rosella TaxID=1033263 RepID=A0AAD7G8N0_MYCRO|nr:hypothetical protein B0H17DRAFT_1139554 [Mycena rosella]
MLPFHRLSRAIVSYRLGYSPQRPYPGRWTTPVVLGASILLATALAVINVPLSAYELDQEYTFRPNDTVPPLPFSALIPAILQHPMGGFSPQILSVGDTLQLNNSVFNFAITAAFNELDDTQPVSSFSYYNNPFSGGCDVTNMTAGIQGPDWTIALTVNCRIPTSITLEWSTNIGTFLAPPLNPARDNFNRLTVDLHEALDNWANQTPDYNGSSITDFYVTVEPCCNCSAGSSLAAETSMDQYGGSLLPTHPPCSSLPARFVVTGGKIFLRSAAPDVPWSALNTLLQNTFQSLYHLVRMELGVILENQIYASPEMYNNSISDVSVPKYLDISAANTSRIATTNAILMADWRDTVRLFNETHPVPVIPYLRSVPRLKPLGSAITSVFVSTFAMLSVAWTIFSLIAGAVAASYSDKAVCEEDEATIHPGPYMLKDLEGQQQSMQAWDTSEASLFVSEDKRVTLMETGIQKNSAAMSEMQFSLAEMQLSLARMRLSLRARGVLEEVDDDPRNINEVERERRDNQALEEHPLLVHRANRTSTFNPGIGGQLSGGML